MAEKKIKVAKIKKVQLNKRGNRKIMSLKNVTKSFGPEIVLRGITFDVYEGDFITILGPSGCGKTTTLKILSGFITPDSGAISFEGKDLTKIPSFDRPFNTVFQNYALFPNMNVYENIAYGLKLKKNNPEEVDKKVMKILKKVKMEMFAKKDVLSLSGGQKQRVAIARALVNEPKVLLLDEPLGALDVKIKKEMQQEIKRLHEEIGITFIYVTHDQEEALSMADTVIVMNDGAIEQLGQPEEIYNEPENK
jgi:spermidine/putrescine transport system ATP-binding protein